MGTERGAVIDLESFALSSGEAASVELRLRPDDIVAGGQRLAIDDDGIDSRIDINRTTTGYAMRLRARTSLSGECSRCLEPAEQEIVVDSREVDQPAATDEELLSPYVTQAHLDAGAWLHDALVLEVPEQVRCRDDCAGLCEVCGATLNDADPADHDHERPPDPRFAKLRELET